MKNYKFQISNCQANFKRVSFSALYLSENCFKNKTRQLFFAMISWPSEKKFQEFSSVYDFPKASFIVTRQTVFES